MKKTAKRDTEEVKNRLRKSRLNEVNIGIDEAIVYRTTLKIEIIGIYPPAIHNKKMMAGRLAGESLGLIRKLGYLRYSGN